MIASEYLSMPYAMCPKCGSIMHLNVSNPTAWYAERYPNLAIYGLVPGVCFYCFGTIKVGDEIITRQLKSDNMEVEPNQRGKITAILVNQVDGNLYVIRLDNGMELTCPRIAIRKPLSNEVTR